MKHWFRIAVAVGLLLASQAALALGLGQIRLKSGLGEPLLAEIPVVSTVPGELEGLRAGLASPETFARIGLDPPQGLVAGLRFNLALDDAGQPVIRVTTAEPVNEPLLTFLVEVDWGQGRLVREYSALVDAPRTVSAPLAPPVQAPTEAVSNTIVREPATAAGEGADPATGTPAGAAGAQDAETIATAPAQSAPAAARPASYTVQAGDTLSQLTTGLGLGVPLEQAMIALLRSNPDAFIDGNVNLLRQGAVLRIPGQSQLLEVDAAQALAQVREQTRAWRQATQAVPQPGPDAGAAPAAGEDGAAAVAADPAGPAEEAARLEIVPPGASDATAAGTRSGVSEGGEGDTMRQELQQANEALAAREAELEEIRDRLADLEKIQADQQALIEMKDNELAAVQAELEQARDQSPAGVDGAAWWLAGGALLLLALLGAWWLRRRADAVPRFRAPPVAQAQEPMAPASRPEPAPSPLAAAFPAARPAEPQAAAPVAAAGAAAVAAPAAPAPAWHASGDTASPAPATAPVPPAVPDPARAPVSPAADGPHEAAPEAVGAGFEGEDDDHDHGVPVTPGEERLELARAYIELGDRDSARQLLTELVVSGDLAARQEATRMLRALD